MAEKKKTTPKKKVAPKKATTTVVKKKSTAKVGKKTTTEKAVTKKTTPKSTTVKKKVAAKKAISKTAVKTTPRILEEGTIMSFQDWKSLVGKTFSLFPTIWWRLATVTLLTTVMMMLTLGLGVLFALFTTGGISVLANEYANLSLGGTPSLSVAWTVGAITLVSLLLVFVVSFIGNIATVLTVKNTITKQQNNPLKTFFAQSWTYFGRYCWLSVRLFWYIVWPALVCLMLMTVVLLVSGNYEPLAAILPIMGLAGGLVIIGLLFWRAVNIIFVTPVLVASDKDVAISLEKGVSLVSGSWWLVLWGLFLFFAPIYLVQSGLELLGATPGSLFEIGTALTSIILSFFVFGPLSATFLYLFMLHLSKRKKINL